ncbi:MAG: hypothetical protein WEC59_04405 [Salibacteraceae bacterium]
MRNQLFYKVWSKLAALSLMAWIAIGCEKLNCEEEAPKLEHDTLRLNDARDSLIFRLSFEDCQGDIGHIGKIDSNTTQSVRTFMYELINGVWQRWYPLNLSDTVGFFAVIPGSNKNREGWLLKGIIEQKFGLANLKQNSDTIRFETYIFDKANHKSNTVTSPRFIFPPS